MSYKVRVLPKAQEVIASWGLSRETLLGIYARFHGELAADPDACLREHIVPLNLWAYHFTTGQAPRRLFFLFAVERMLDAEELRVVGGRLNREEPGVE